MTSKYEELLKYSNPDIVAHRLQEYLPETHLYVSNRKDKKYMIKRPLGGWSHFGQMGYSDFTRHGDPVRRERYLKRAMAIRGQWRKDPYSSNILSMLLLW